MAHEWAQNRHQLTGGLLKTIQTDVQQNAQELSIDVFMARYGLIQSKGVQASRIPYNPGSGAKRSLYIQALQDYATRRMGLGEKESLRAAFAIAAKQKRYGMQIRTRGKGTGWIDKATERIMPEVDNLSMRYLGDVVETYLKEI